MAITVSQIASNVATVTVAVDADTVTIQYFPGRVTEKTLALADMFSSTTETTIVDNFKLFNVELANLIKSWDVLENDGQTMFPLDASRFTELPLAFRVKAFMAIIGNIRPEAFTA